MPKKNRKLPMKNQRNHQNKKIHFMAKAKKQVTESNPIVENTEAVEMTTEVGEVTKLELPEKYVEIKIEEKQPEPSIIANELSNEEKIINYIGKAYGNPVKLNDFLKSLYGAPKLNEPPLWKQQNVSKQIRFLLENMSTAGQLKIVNSTHLLLGKPYHKGEQLLAANHDLDTVNIFVEK